MDYLPIVNYLHKECYFKELVCLLVCSKYLYSLKPNYLNNLNYLAKILNKCNIYMCNSTHDDNSLFRFYKRNTSIISNLIQFFRKYKNHKSNKLEIGFNSDKSYGILLNIYIKNNIIEFMLENDIYKNELVDCKYISNPKKLF